MQSDTVQSIAIDDIFVINPRSRGQIIAEGIRQNICNIGLKRPISVTVAHEPTDGKKYDLVCGQGRLEAFIAAGETMIPAIVCDATREEALLMSLVENIARRRGNGIESLQSIRYLRELGYDEVDISQKTDLNPQYITSILNLIDRGEEYLVDAVENGRIPLRIALAIAGKTGPEMQQELTRAYENKEISGSDLKRFEKCVSRRERFGRKLATPSRLQSENSARALIEKYQRRVKQKQAMVEQSNYIQHCMAFVAGAMQSLLQDLHFTNQLEVAQLCDVPERLLTLLEEINDEH